MHVIQNLSPIVANMSELSMLKKINLETGPYANSTDDSYKSFSEKRVGRCRGVMSQYPHNL